MAALTPAPSTTGKNLFEGTTDFRSRDDLADRKAGGVYSHSVYEWSATEANEWVGFMQYVRQVAKAGALALKCRNETGGSLAAGPVRVTGYNATEDVFLVGLADADGNSPADFLLLASLANNTNGTAYNGGDFSFNTAGRTVGDPCYLSASGDVTFTAPSGADQIVQEIGRVKVVNASGTIAGCVQIPTKVGSSYLQTAGGGISDGDKGDITVSSSGSVWTIDNGVVTFAKMQNITTDRLIGRDTASSGSPEEISVGGGLEFTGSAGIQRSALTGDVTASAGSNATTIANDAVTYAKMQNVSATDRLLGRDTAGVGDVEELTVGGGVEFTGSGGIQRSALTGDVTATAGSNATTISNDAVTTAKILDGNVTYAKIQDTSAASVLIGRGSAAGAGDVQEITLGAGLTMAGQVLSGSGLADGDKGDITVTGGGATWTIDSNAITTTKITDANVTDAKLANMGARSVKGRSANSSGVPADISFASAAGKFLGDRGSVLGAFYPTQILTKSGNYTLVTDDYGATVVVSATATITLPAPATVGAGWWVCIKKTVAAGSNVTVARNGSETIDGRSASDVLYGQYATATYVTDGTNWHTVNLSDSNPIRSRKGQLESNFDVNNTTTFANVTGMSFPVNSGEVWNFEFWLPLSQFSTASGAKWQITSPTVTYISYVTRVDESGVSAPSHAPTYRQSSSSSWSVNQGTSAAGICTIKGGIKPSANGTVQLQFAQQTAAVGNTSIYAGAWYSAERVV